MLDAAVVIAGTLAFLPRMGPPGLPGLAIWVCLFGYAGLTFFVSGRPVLVHRLKAVLLGFIILFTLGYQTVHMINLRHHNTKTPVSAVHDHPPQMEASVNFLLNGIDPYSADFHTTDMAKWGSWNPALLHVIALPFTFLKSVPFSVAWRHLFGWYDDRISQLFLLVLLAVSAYCIPRDPSLKLTAVAAATLSPQFMPFFTEGRSDIVFLSFLMACLALLRHGKTEAALLMLSLSLGSKHTALFITPFLGVYLWKKGMFTSENCHVFVLPALLLAAIFLPFLFWDFHGFIDDVIAYPAGTAKVSYPIAGFGLSRILLQLHVIKSGSAAFPILPFTVFLIPLLVWLMVRVARKPTLGNVVLCYVTLLCPFWFVSRFFNDNYLGVVGILVALAAILLHDEHLSEGKKLHFPWERGA